MQENYAGYREWKSWDEAGFGELKPQTKAAFDVEVKRTGLTDIKNVAEVGFGHGSFLSYARQRGWTITGTELLPSLVATAQKAGFQAAADLDDVADGSLDLIAAFDVLEHLTHDQLEDMLALFRRKLRVGGAVLVRFPNADSPVGLVNQHGDVTHITHIGSVKARYFAERGGFAVRYIGPEAQPILCGHTAHMIHRLIAVPARALLDAISNFLFHPGGDKVSMFSKNLVLTMVRTD